MPFLGLADCFLSIPPLSSAFMAAAHRLAGVEALLSHQRSAHTSTLNLGAGRLQRGRAAQRACPESLGCFSSFDAAASKPSDLRCRAQQPSQEVRATLPGAAVRM